jgi:phage gp36-like protein
MVAYASPQDVRLAVARDPDKIRGSAGTISEPQLQLMIDMAQAEIDGRLRPRYVVPFEEDAVPELVRVLTIDIAAYHAGLTFYQEKDMKDTDPVARRYKWACCILKDIAGGFVVLNTDGTEKTAATTSWYGAPVDPVESVGWLTTEFDIDCEMYCWPP